MAVSRDDSFGILETTIQECLDAGHFRQGDVRNYAAMIWANVHGVASLAIATPYLTKGEAFAIADLSKSSPNSRNEDVKFFRYSLNTVK